LSAFVPSLPACLACHSEEARRQRLLDRRLEYLEMGVEEKWILEEYPSFDLSRIRHPPTEEHNLDRRAWC
jgi:hypothetical protein